MLTSSHSGVGRWTWKSMARTSGDIKVRARRHASHPRRGRQPADGPAEGAPAGGRHQPACACYRRSALGAVQAALDTYRLKVAEVLEELDVGWVEGLDPELFWNINTPEDYQVFLSALCRRAQ